MLRSEEAEHFLRLSIDMYLAQGMAGLHASANRDLGLLFAEQDRLELALQYYPGE